MQYATQLQHMTANPGAYAPSASASTETAATTGTTAPTGGMSRIYVYAQHGISTLISSSEICKVESQRCQKTLFSQLFTPHEKEHLHDIILVQWSPKTWKIG